jgi:hypothetical protein
LGYFERLRGYDDEVAIEFSLKFPEYTREGVCGHSEGTVIRINEASINRITSFPMGLPWDKEERQEAITAKKAFFLPNEKPDEDKNGIKRETLPHPWPEVAYHIIKYITCEGKNECGICLPLQTITPAQTPFKSRTT